MATEVCDLGKETTSESRKMENESGEVMYSVPEYSDVRIPTLPEMPASFVDPPNSVEQEMKETDLIVDSSVSEVFVSTKVAVEDKNGNEDVEDVPVSNIDCSASQIDNLSGITGSVCSQSLASQESTSKQMQKKSTTIPMLC